MAVDDIPVVALVDRFGLVKGQGLDIQIRIGTLADAVFGQSARIAAVVDQSAFLGQDCRYAVIEVAHCALQVIRRNDCHCTGCNSRCLCRFWLLYWGFLSLVFGFSGLHAASTVPVVEPRVLRLRSAQAVVC